MNKIKPVSFNSLCRKKFFCLSKSQRSVTCAEYGFLFTEFHDVKTERSMSCQELFDKQCPLVQYRKSGNT